MTPDAHATAASNSAFDSFVNPDVDNSYCHHPTRRAGAEPDAITVPVSYPKIAAFDRSDGTAAATVAAEDDVVTVPGARPAPNGESAPAGVITNSAWFAADPKSVPDTFAVIPRSSYKNTSDASTGTATLVNVEPTAAVDTESAITTNEPPWDPWTLHVLETRIESCHENPDNLIALALLDRGGYCPPLPGR